MTPVKIAGLDCRVIFLQRGSSTTQSPEQLPASPLLTTPSSQSNRDAVTPQASLQAPGTRTPLLLSGHTKQHSLAAALARAAGISPSVARADPETRAGLRADERHGPSRAGTKAFGRNGPLAAEATQASGSSAGFQLSGSHTAGLESARQSVVLAHSCMTGMRLQILQLQAGRMTSQAAHLSTVGIAGSAVTAAQQLPHHTLLVAPLCTLACHLQLWALLRRWPLLLPLLSVQGLSCQPPA